MPCCEGEHRLTRPLLQVSLWILGFYVLTIVALQLLGRAPPCLAPVKDALLLCAAQRLRDAQRQAGSSQPAWAALKCRPAGLDRPEV